MFLSSYYFLSTFGKRNLTHLTTDVMFTGQRFAILAMFLWRGCMIFCLLDRLRNFICLEVAWFCVWRGCVIFLTHSLRLHDLLFWRFCDFIAVRLPDFFVERLLDFLCVKRLCDFLCEEVPWFLVWKRYFLVKKKVFKWKHFFGEIFFVTTVTTVTTVPTVTTAT